MGLAIAFWLLAIVGVGAALTIVLLRDVFRAALLLVLTLITVAGLYVTLSADFLAVIQILVYVGGISVLIIISIMLTRDIQQGSPANRMRTSAMFVAIAFFGVLLYALVNTNWPVSTAAPVAPTTSALADRLLGQNGFLLPVEIGAALLLAAIIGAIVLVRDK